MPWSRELAQLPTPMRATRTLPFESGIGSSVMFIQLLSDVQDALQDCDPGGYGEHDDRPLERAPGSEHEPRGDDDDAPVAVSAFGVTRVPASRVTARLASERAPVV